MVYTEYGFDSSLLPSLQAIKERVALNKAALIIIDGGVGEGKTTLACEIASWYQKGWLDKVEDLLAMGGTDFTKKLEKAAAKREKVVVYDEGGDFASRSALTRFNSTMNRIFETYRSTQILVILCLPDFSDLDKSLMKKRIARLLLHTKDRKKTYGRIMFYSLWRMWYLKAKMKEVTVPPQAYSMVTPNGRGLFKDLPEEYRIRLEKISNKGKSKIRKESYAKEKGLISSDDAAKRMGIAKATFWSKYSASLKEKEKIGSLKFYSIEDVDNLRNNRASS